MKTPGIHCQELIHTTHHTRLCFTTKMWYTGKAPPPVKNALWTGSLLRSDLEDDDRKWRDEKSRRRLEDVGSGSDRRDNAETATA